MMERRPSPPLGSSLPCGRRRRPSNKLSATLATEADLPGAVGPEEDGDRCLVGTGQDLCLPVLAVVHDPLLDIDAFLGEDPPRPVAGRSELHRVHDELVVIGHGILLPFLPH